MSSVKILRQPLSPPSKLFRYHRRILSSYPQATSKGNFQRSFSTSRQSAMPLYMCYCPDYPDVLSKRMEVRQAHLDRANKDKDEGVSVFGRGFLSDSYATSSTESSRPNDVTQGLSGSLMILRFPSLEAAWARIKDDLYWKAGVWDKEKTTIKELIGAPGDETVKLQ